MDRDIGFIPTLGWGIGKAVEGAKGLYGLGSQGIRLATQHGPEIARSIGRWVKPTPGKWGWIQPGLDTFGGVHTALLDKEKGATTADAVRHGIANTAANLAANKIDPRGLWSMTGAFGPWAMETIHEMRTGRRDEGAPVVDTMANVLRFANPGSYAAWLSDRFGRESRQMPFSTSWDPDERDKYLEEVYVMRDDLTNNLLKTGWNAEEIQNYLNQYPGYADRSDALDDTSDYYNYNLVTPKSEAGRLLLNSSWNQ